jgi:glutaredoxin
LGKVRSLGAFVLYMKAGCPLCREAEAALAAAGLAYETCDILEDPALYRRYRYRIPVLARDGVELTEGRAFDPAALRRLTAGH